MKNNIEQLRKEYQETVEKYNDVKEKVQMFMYFLYTRGFPITQIADMFQVSRQRIWQIIKPKLEDDEDAYDPTKPPLEVID